MFDWNNASLDGCTDGGCYLRKNHGMVTNGGCHCMPHIGDITKSPLKAAIFMLRLATEIKQMREEARPKESK